MQEPTQSTMHSSINTGYNNKKACNKKCYKLFYCFKDFNPLFPDSMLHCRFQENQLSLIRSFALRSAVIKASTKASIFPFIMLGSC